MIWPDITGTGEFRSQTCCRVILVIFTYFLIPSLCLPGLWQMKSVVTVSEFFLKNAGSMKPIETVTAAF